MRRRGVSLIWWRYAYAVAFDATTSRQLCAGNVNPALDAVVPGGTIS
ncbi:MAG: hypothetical protein ACE14M_14415 [Terriglobales bacterium]